MRGAIIASTCIMFLSCGGNGGGGDEDTGIDVPEEDPVEDAEDDTDDPAEEPDTETTLSYDDGDAEEYVSPWSDVVGGQIAVSFTPPEYPAIIRSASFYIIDSGATTTEFGVRVYDDHGSLPGEPGADILPATVTASASFGYEWVDVDLSSHGITIEDGSFFVAMEWLTAPGMDGSLAQFLGADADDPDRQSWWKHTPTEPWVRIEDIGSTGDRDAMIRAVVLH